MSGAPTLPSRRLFLASSAGLVAGASTARAFEPQSEVAPDAVEPFHGPHQGGVTTPQQAHTYFATFDVKSEVRNDLRALLQRWTEAGARLCAGQPVETGDSGDALGLPPARLTLTFGFGPTLFLRDGHDRFGLADRRPAALADLPTFPGDQLQPARCGGDLAVQACANDPQTAFHAVRQLVRLAYGTADLRWVQSGYVPALVGQTPRNLMGFRDGSNNPDPRNPADMREVVWAGSEAPAWMQGGTYLVARRIRIALEHWDRMNTGFQEQTVGRRKADGAPIGGHGEMDKADFTATDADGNPVIAENAHVRLASSATTGARIFRRGYSYNDGASFTAERWPPWRQAMEYDAGLLFLAYQKDPRAQFSQIFAKMSRFDMLNQFVTHTGSALFAIPPGIAPGEMVGSGLLA